MPYCRLLSPVVILGAILIKAYLAVTLDSDAPIPRPEQSQRALLQSSPTAAGLEYDPLLDDPLERQSLTALYAATGGQYWTYGSHFYLAPVLPTVYGSANQSALEALIFRFNRTAWLNVSVSYCQW